MKRSDKPKIRRPSGVPATTESNRKAVTIADGGSSWWVQKAVKGIEFPEAASTGGDIGALERDADELALSEKIGNKLKEFGIRFVGIDMAYPYLVELNLVNPGGINYHKKATGEDIADILTKTAIEGAMLAGSK